MNKTTLIQRGDAGIEAFRDRHFLHDEGINSRVFRRSVHGTSRRSKVILTTDLDRAAVGRYALGDGITSNQGLSAFVTVDWVIFLVLQTVYRAWEIRSYCLCQKHRHRSLSPEVSSVHFGRKALGQYRGNSSFEISLPCAVAAMPYVI